MRSDYGTPSVIRERGISVCILARGLVCVVAGLPTDPRFEAKMHWRCACRSAVWRQTGIVTSWLDSTRWTRSDNSRIPREGSIPTKARPCSESAC